METKKTFCVICEATCGLEVDVEDNQISDIRANKDHVVSRGHLCVKGKRFASIQHSQEPEKIFVSKKGIQGLYIGFAYDGVMFASDVYGLVESCKYFIPIDSDTSFELSSTEGINCENPSITIFNHNLKNISENAIT